ncbi:MAG TPA: FHA domain-containing protein [Polyangiaceae bacterium]|nr:FHA domain-containing protein [Polyangiaceae bacterium]
MAEMSVGRASGAGLRLAQSHVSLQHASLRWTERNTWELRDLQSKNGTFINGQRIPAGAPVRLEVGAELAFGSPAEPFVVEDVSPPRAMLVRIGEEREPIVLRDALVALPSLEEPSVSLFRDEGGQWFIDSRDRVGQLADGDLITIGNEPWRCCFPTAHGETELLENVAGLFALSELEVRLGVSQDEEAIELTLSTNGRDLRLGQKACHYVLLMLARCRQGRELPAGAEVDDGWISVGALLELLRVSEQRLNVDIFRIRQELKSAGVVDAVGIIQRDPQQRRVRLGTENVILTKRGEASA